MLDNTMVLFGSASSAYHTSRNYPLILAGGKRMGLKHGQFLKLDKGNKDNQLGAGSYPDENRRKKVQLEELPLSNLYLTMLQKLGVETEAFGGSTGTLNAV